MSECVYQYQSSLWDMDMKLEDILEYNEVCKVDRNYKRHKLDDCYDGYCMYLKHPKSEGYSIMIGINYDGFMYLGDGGNNDLPLEKTVDVVSEMYFYGEWQRYKIANMNKLD